MCDYSLQNVKTRPAKVGDKLVVTNFNTGTNGFASPDDPTTAVCVLPGTEIAFAKEDAPSDPRVMQSIIRAVFGCSIPSEVAIFRQIDTQHACVHHDALEFPGARIVKLTALKLGQRATVLQLPAAPKTAAEAKEQERLPAAA